MWKIRQFYTMYSPVSSTLRESHRPQLTFGLFIYKHTSICALLHTYIHTYAPAQCTCQHVLAHACTYTHAHIQLYTYTCMYLHTYGCTHTSSHTCTAAHTGTHMSLHTHTHVHVPLHTDTNTHMHTHIYVHKTLEYMCNCTCTNILLYSFELKETDYSMGKLIRA